VATCIPTGTNCAIRTSVCGEDAGVEGATGIGGIAEAEGAGIPKSRVTLRVWRWVGHQQLLIANRWRSKSELAVGRYCAVSLRIHVACGVIPHIPIPMLGLGIGQVATDEVLRSPGIAPGVEGASAEVVLPRLSVELFGLEGEVVVREGEVG